MIGFDKWTVALAASGMVSVASVAKTEEGPSSVIPALAPTTLSGYVDTSAQWNLGTGDTFVPPYKFNSPSKADGFNLDVIQVRIEKPLEEAEWAAGYRVDLWAGPDASSLGTQSPVATGKSDFAVRQAYVALRVPVLNGIDFKVGVFDSVLGYESVESPDDPNYTRSYGHTIEPQTHTGVLASYRFNEVVATSVGIADTTDPSINSRAFAPVQPTNPYAESYKTYMGAVALTAPECLGFLEGSTLYGGVVNGFNNSVVGSSVGMPTLNAYVGGTIATPVTGLRLGAAWDLLNLDSTPHSGPFSGTKDEADIWSIAGYASFQATEKLSFHGRLECAPGDIDRGFAGVNFRNLGRENALYAATATAQYDLWKNVISRVEFRWDHVEHGMAFGAADPTTGAPTRSNAYLLAANIIYRF